MNQRRAELIRKKNREGLNDAEKVEFDHLQAFSQAALERAFPVSTVGDIDLQRLHSKLD